MSHRPRPSKGCGSSFNHGGNMTRRARRSHARHRTLPDRSAHTRLIAGVPVLCHWVSRHRKASLAVDQEVGRTASIQSIPAGYQDIGWLRVCPGASHVWDCPGAQASTGGLIDSRASNCAPVTESGKRVPVARHALIGDIGSISCVAAPLAAAQPRPVATSFPASSATRST